MNRNPSDPWSLAGMINNFETICDTEGRPVFEGRAPVGVKEKVPMVMRKCPYPDERQGRMMNVSALNQITEHLDAALENIASYRLTLPSTVTSWDFFYRAILDQLGQAALYILRNKPVLPVQLSVTYKVATGYQVPLRELLNLELSRQAPVPTVANLLDYVKQRKALVGKREVCAAPMSMVTKVTEVLYDGLPDQKTKARPERVAVAQALMLQTWLGIVWRRFDLAAERQLLLEDLGPATLFPRTPYLKRLLADRLGEIEQSEVVDYFELPHLLPPDLRQSLRRTMAFLEGGQELCGETVSLIQSLMEHDDAVVVMSDLTRRPVFAQRFVAYLKAYRSFVAHFEAIEIDLRQRLGFPTEPPVLLDPSFFPSPRALKWFELVSGHLIRPNPEVSGGLMFQNQHRSIPIPLIPVSKNQGLGFGAEENGLKKAD